MAKISKREARRKAEQRARDKGTSYEVELGAVMAEFDVTDYGTSYGDSGSSYGGSSSYDSGSSYGSGSDSGSSGGGYSGE